MKQMTIGNICCIKPIVTRCQARCDTETPANEIEKAIKIKEAYYADKQSQNR